MQHLLPHPLRTNKLLDWRARLGLIISHLEVGFLRLSVQLERLLELQTEAGQVVDVPPALRGHHVHPGDHADAGTLRHGHGLWDGDMGAGVDQLAGKRQEDEGNGLFEFARDEAGHRTLGDGVDTGADVLPVGGSVGLTLAGADQPRPGDCPHRPLGASGLAAD